MVKNLLLNKYYAAIKNDDAILKDAILSKLDDNMVVLDAGAGSGKKFDISFLKNKCKKVIGVDIDQSICDNEYLDKTIIAPLQKIDLPDESIDLIYSRYVFEHLENPDVVVAELFRILKSGGHVIVITPNKYHYVSQISRLTPHTFHEFVNKKRGRDEEDTFPTYYNCNTAKDMRRIFEYNGFKTVNIIMHEGTPNYMLWNRTTFYLGFLYERMVNSHEFLKNLRITILGTFQKI